MPFVDLSGGRIEYRMILGDALRAPTLVFLHDGLGAAATWRDFPDRLARRLGAPALVYSRFGYGRSSPIFAPRSARFLHEEALDVLPELLDRLAVQRPLLIGHSDGASIALIFAATSGRDTAGLVLIAPHVLVESVTLAHIAHIAEKFEQPDSPLRDRLQRYHDDADTTFRGWSRIWLDPSFRTWSLGPECASLGVASLLIQGDKDVYGTLAQLDAIEAVAPVRPRRLVLAGVGHRPHGEAESAVFDAVAAFAGPLNGAKRSS